MNRKTRPKITGFESHLADCFERGEPFRFADFTSSGAAPRDQVVLRGSVISKLVRGEPLPGETVARIAHPNGLVIDGSQLQQFDLEAKAPSSTSDKSREIEKIKRPNRAGIKPTDPSDRDKREEAGRQIDKAKGLDSNFEREPDIEIVGNLDLSDLKFGSVRLLRIKLTGHLSIENSSFRSIDLSDSHFTSIAARSIKTDGAFTFECGCIERGIDLRSARIGGDLELNGSKILGLKTRECLSARSIRVRGSVYLRNARIGTDLVPPGEAKSSKEGNLYLDKIAETIDAVNPESTLGIDMRDANISGSFHIESAKIFIKHEKKGERIDHHALRISGAKIGGSFRATNSIVYGTVDASGVRLGAILELNQAVVFSQSDVAIRFLRSRVKGNLELNLKAILALRNVLAKEDSCVDFTDSKIGGNIWIGPRSEMDEHVKSCFVGKLVFRDCDIGGDVEIKGSDYWYNTFEFFAGSFNKLDRGSLKPWDNIIALQSKVSPVPKKRRKIVSQIHQRRITSDFLMPTTAYHQHHHKPEELMSVSDLSQTLDADIIGSIDPSSSRSRYSDELTGESHDDGKEDRKKITDGLICFQGSSVDGEIKVEGKFGGFFNLTNIEAKADLNFSNTTIYDEPFRYYSIRLEGAKVSGTVDFWNLNFADTLDFSNLSVGRDLWLRKISATRLDRLKPINITQAKIKGDLVLYRLDADLFHIEAQRITVGGSFFISNTACRDADMLAISWEGNPFLWNHWLYAPESDVNGRLVVQFSSLPGSLSFPQSTINGGVYIRRTQSVALSMCGWFESLRTACLGRERDGESFAATVRSWWGEKRSGYISVPVSLLRLPFSLCKKVVEASWAISMAPLQQIAYFFGYVTFERDQLFDHTSMDFSDCVIGRDFTIMADSDFSGILNLEGVKIVHALNLPLYSRPAARRMRRDQRRLDKPKEGPLRRLLKRWLPFIGEPSENEPLTAEQRRRADQRRLLRKGRKKMIREQLGPISAVFYSLRERLRWHKAYPHTVNFTLGRADTISVEGKRGRLNYPIVLDGSDFDQLALDGATRPLEPASAVRFLKNQPSNHLRQSFKRQPWRNMIGLFEGWGRAWQAQSISLAKQNMILRGLFFDSYRHIFRFHWLPIGGRRFSLPIPWPDFAYFGRMIWLFLFGLLVGYGYRVLRPALIAVTLIATSTIVFSYANRLDYMKKVDSATMAFLAGNPDGQAYNFYPEFNAFVYTLDVFLPVVDLFQERYWHPVKISDKPDIISDEKMRASAEALYGCSGISVGINIPSRAEDQSRFAWTEDRFRETANYLDQADIFDRSIKYLSRATLDDIVGSSVGIVSSVWSRVMNCGSTFGPYFSNRVAHTSESYLMRDGGLLTFRWMLSLAGWGIGFLLLTALTIGQNEFTGPLGSKEDKQ